MKSIVLETKELTKTFRGNDEKALDRVSLRIPEGCVYGCWGQTGRKVHPAEDHHRQVQPDEGQVLFKGSRGADRRWQRQEFS